MTGGSLDCPGRRRPPRQGWQLFGCALASLTLLFSQPAHAEPDAPAQKACYATSEAASEDAVCIGSADFYGDVCRAIALYADREDLPPPFFARLIWQESRFNPNSVSGAGAQGIAQFMPGTARLRGLKQSFQPAEALAYSADYLRFLTDKFGNLGLAAAAYNAGEGRVSNWIAKGGFLPAETRDYVFTITGIPVEAWRSTPPDDADFTLDKDLPFEKACIKLAENRKAPRLAAHAEWQPWGVLISQNWTEALARSGFTRTQQRFPKLLGNEQPLILSVVNPRFGKKPRISAMVGRQTQTAASAFCQKLKTAGGSCIVVRN